MRQFKTITMIGSMKFYQTMLDEETRLTDMGFIVMHPVKSGHEVISDKLRDQYDQEIRIKIDMADMVYVIDVDGYIGESTSGEIAYAVLNGKRLTYFSGNLLNGSTGVAQTEPSADDIIDNIINCITGMNEVALIGSHRFIALFISSCRKLALYGIITHTPAIFPFSTNEISQFTDSTHKILDELHFRKIKNSYRVLVVDGSPGEKSYIGKDTSVELNKAIELNKKIYFTTGGGVDQLINDMYQSNKS